ncbi:hypothetical protein [Streptomyces sp. NPDC002644]
MSEPLVAVETWRPVMEAAGYRCQCTGACGVPHDRTEGRCHREHDGYTSKHGSRIRLLAAPVDVRTPLAQAVALPPGELRAWCPGCFTAAQRAARRALPPADGPGLFDLTEGGGA